MRRSRLVIDRRSVRADQITHLILSIVKRYAKFDLENNDERDFVRELRDQLWCDGAQMITEGDRIAAGLQPRNIEGLTVDELCIIEATLTMAMRQPPIVAQAGIFSEKDLSLSPAPGHIVSVPAPENCPRCGFLGPMQPGRFHAEERSAALRATMPDRSWQPIETAPKDGTAILLGFWYQGRFAQYQAFYGTHGWMENSRQYHPEQFQKWFSLWHPLPAPPADAILSAGAAEREGANPSER